MGNNESLNEGSRKAKLASMTREMFCEESYLDSDLLKGQLTIFLDGYTVLYYLVLF